ncbi:MAG: ABC transporter permease subunit [Candidatus Omnitrophica bacterium]|nr:ABC transporter permease subunit [Candidatus Omnitrophota bacterium]
MNSSLSHKSATATETTGSPSTGMNLNPSRFKTAPLTLWTDRMMNRTIKGGGLAVILTVLAIFVFIFMQSLPLFGRAKIHPRNTIQLDPSIQPLLIGADEWGELPYVLESQGLIHFISSADGKTVSQDDLSKLLEAKISSVFRHRRPGNQTFYTGTEDGRFAAVDLKYIPVFTKDSREIHRELNPGELYALSDKPYPVRLIAGAGTGDQKLIAAILAAPEGNRFVVTRLIRTVALFGPGEESMEEIHDLTGEIEGKIQKILVNGAGDEFVVLNEEGKIFYFVYTDEAPILRQIFTPFKDTQDHQVVSMDYLNGDVTLVLTNASGVNKLYSLFVAEGQPLRMYYYTKTLPPLDGGAEFYAPSLRNKAFLIGHGSSFSLRYGTTATIRAKGRLDSQIKSAILGAKYDRIFLLDSENRLHLYDLTDPHPEAGWQAFMGKVWYEGYSKPDYIWQSTGGTDDFEPKLSFVPLILGTLKGTLYAMMFALPLSLLAALYTSQFARPSFKRTIKPVMEIMASLPSVVLGFLAALWLAPLIEDKVPSFLMAVTLIPLFVLIFGQVYSRLPASVRMHVKPGYEWLLVLPIIAAGIWISWNLGPAIEKIFCTVYDSETNLRSADFRLWWATVTGMPFEQRNSLVVGFMMGFAVIPIIFTIAEDALSNVPKSLTSASLALGASRWQTAIRVVIPTAFPGIFSALMVGLGRAIGETMIVVMATGNTPVMDFNIFSGMRTLSANIAVELPEAPYLGTLYRALFLGATILFMMTFVLNTIAEVIRQKLRTKYRVL